MLGKLEQFKTQYRCSPTHKMGFFFAFSVTYIWSRALEVNENILCMHVKEIHAHTIYLH